MSELFRDPRYLMPLAVLFGVILISAAMGAGPGALDARVPSIPLVPRAPENSATTDLTRDYARGIELGVLRETALSYYRQNGSFPGTGDRIIEICKDNANVACGLKLANPDIPIEDGRSPYLYASDGATYALFIARSDVQGDTAQCPELVPRELASHPLMCARVAAPVPGAPSPGGAP